MPLVLRFSIVLILFPLFLFSQTPQEAERITQNYDKAKLRQMQQTFLEEYEKDKAYALVYAKERGIETIIKYQGESYAELQRVLPDGTLIYYKTRNVDAAISTRTNHINTGGSTGFNLDGQNMIAYVWDGGHARVTHQEYDGSGGNDRVSVADAVAEGGLDLNFHAAHVVGTIGAAGVLNSGVAKGMATHSQIYSYKWNQDLSEATTAASNGMLVSNHSYGFRSEFVPDYYFGAYINDSRDWDNLHYNAPYYLMVVAAGNDGNSNYNASPLDSNFPQFDKLTGHSVSKNNMVVANAQDANVGASGNLISVNINSSSSQGPTDDFRIKPDITGNGTGLISTLDTSDTALGSLTGTSMASPNVAGTLLLLQQHHNNLYNTYMRSATLKGLALHTADEAGMGGPDANYGWGLLNAKKAAETLSGKGTTTIVEELQLFQGQTYTMTVNSDGVNDLLASVSWTDPAGIATTSLNNNSARLVNDLDVRVTKNTSTFFPWRLTGVNTNANDADNTKDNFERVDVSSASGSYTITVTHKGTLSGGSQVFSLIATGVTAVPVLCDTPQNVSVDNLTLTTADLSWNPSPTVDSGYEWVVMAAGAAPDPSNAIASGTVASGINSVQVTGLLASTYDAYVRTNCGAAGLSSWSLVVNFVIGYCDAGALSNGFEKIANVTFNSINNSSTSTSGYEDFTSISTIVNTSGVYTNSFTATISTPYPSDQILVWIDFNQDGDFLDPNENVFTSMIASGPHTGSIEIPANATLGATTMRVRLHDTANGPNNTPCGDSSYGEVEDYTIIVEQAGNTDEDTDGDGVSDVSDLDSDNDGILDVNEGKGATIVNAALTGTATQSSTASGGVASRAIDGNTNGNFNNNSVTHTSTTSTTEYWQVDLNQTLAISEIVFFNRADCCANRISKVYVLVSNTPFPSNATDLAGALSNADFTYQFLANQGPASVTLPVNILGRYVRLQKSGTNIDNVLSIAELQIFGRMVDDTDGDGLPNHLDLDSDNDGIPDNVEAQNTFGYSAPVNDSEALYITNSGINSVYVANSIIPEDSDGDGISDFIDSDSDNDGLTDLVESFDPVPGGIVGVNGMFAGAENADNYTDVNGLAYNGTSLTLLDTDNDVLHGADYDYRDIPQLESYFGTTIISSFSAGSITPIKANAYLNIISNNMGLVITRVNGANSITNPVEGMVIYDTADYTFKVNTDGTTSGWRAFGN